MNDDSATTPARDSQPGLARRLDLLAGTATIDLDATWDQIQARITTTEPGRPWPRRRVLVAVAAALLVLLGATIILRRHDDGHRVDTVDDTTSTTTGSDDRRLPPTSRTPTALEPGDQPPEGAAGGSRAGAGSRGSSGRAPGPSDRAGEPNAPGGAPDDPTAPTAPTAPPAPTTPTAPPDPNAVPDGRAPAVELSLTSTVSVVATVWQDSGAFHMNIWQTSPWRLHTTWSWSSQPGQNCLAGITDTLEFPENAPFTSETFSWGLVRADAAWVGVVTGPDDYDVASPIVLGSEALPGLRPWIARTTTDDPIRRFRALTETGTVLHYAEPPTWDARPDSC